MSRKMIASAVLFWAFALTCPDNGLAGRGTGAAPPSPAIDCNDKNAVVSAIYDRFKNDPVLKDQISHINVDFRNGVVTLRGYAFRPKGAKSPKAVNAATATA